MNDVTHPRPEAAGSDAAQAELDAFLGAEAERPWWRRGLWIGIATLALLAILILSQLFAGDGAGVSPIWRPASRPPWTPRERRWRALTARRSRSPRGRR